MNVLTSSPRKTSLYLDRGITAAVAAAGAAAAAAVELLTGAPF